MNIAFLVTMIFLTGSVRDVQAFKNALHAATEGPSPCFQFTDYPQQATYTLNVEWHHRYTLFVQSRNEVSMELYNSKHELVWKETGAARSAGLYHQGHPEKKMYPGLFKALGCTYKEPTRRSQKPSPQ